MGRGPAGRPLIATALERAGPYEMRWMQTTVGKFYHRPGGGKGELSMVSHGHSGILPKRPRPVLTLLRTDLISRWLI